MVKRPHIEKVGAEEVCAPFESSPGEVGFLFERSCTERRPPMEGSLSEVYLLCKGSPGEVGIIFKSSLRKTYLSAESKAKKSRLRSERGSKEVHVPVEIQYKVRRFVIEGRKPYAF
jgi:hypothetical protein